MVVAEREIGSLGEVWVNRNQVEHVSDFMYLGFVIDELGKDEYECCGEVASGRKVTDTT